MAYFKKYIKASKKTTRQSNNRSVHVLQIYTIKKNVKLKSMLQTWQYFKIIHDLQILKPVSIFVKKK